MPTQSDRNMSEQKNSIIVAVTLALVSAFILGGVSFALFPSWSYSPTLFEKTSLLTALESTSSVRSLPSSKVASISVFTPLDAVCIESDGSLNSTNVPITRAGDTYTFSGDVVNQTIVVQLDNIVIDGAAHKLQGFKVGESYANAGMVLEGRSNVTIKNLVLSQFSTPIWVHNSSWITITDNTFADNSMGDRASSVTYSKIVSNNFNETLIESISLSRSSEGEASSTANNVISGNNITDGAFGINVYSCSWNIITWNNLVNVYSPITAGENTTVANNNMINGIDGITLSSHCSVYQNTILNFSQSGISIQGIDSTIFENIVANCSHSLLLDSYSDYPLGNNTVYHNNFVNNTENLLLYGNASQSVNFWDNGKEGNYWSGYSGADANGDGVGDTPFAIGPGNVDRYPLMQPYVSQTANDQSLQAVLFGAGGIAAAIGISALTFSIITQKTRPKKGI